MKKKKMRIGMLTSGGDCPGLNAAIRGVAKAAYDRFDAEIVGIADGYLGLIEGSYQEMKREKFSGILTLGGTILGTSRQPFRKMRVVEDNVDKVEEMKLNYKKMELDCLVTLGGNGTHKTANLLAQEGLHVIGLPKTIDNDLYGTEVTFGFHTAVDIATDVVDRIHTTAASHGRCMVIEIMGNKAGWLTLYAGVAGGADVIVLPEIPYDMDAIIDKVKERNKQKKGFSILTVAEGAFSSAEAKLKRKDRLVARAERGFASATQEIAAILEEKAEVEARIVVPGHIQRGGTPSAYDRVLATEFGVHAVQLMDEGRFGMTVAMKHDQVVANPLADIAGKSKLVPPDDKVLRAARHMGVSFGV